MDTTHFVPGSGSGTALGDQAVQLDLTVHVLIDRDIRNVGKAKGDPVVMGLLKSTMFPLQQVLEGIPSPIRDSIRLPCISLSTDDRASVRTRTYATTTCIKNKNKARPIQPRSPRPFFLDQPFLT